VSLRTRIVLGIVLLVGFATVLMWGVTSRGVFRPFARAVVEAFLEQAVYVAEQVEAGEDPEELGARLGLEVRILDPLRPPGAGRGARPRRGRGRFRPEPPPPAADMEMAPPGTRVVVRDGRRLALPPGPRTRVAVETTRGWVLVKRELDLERPQQQLRIFLAIAGFLVLLVAAALARAATRPLTTAREGMERIAAGDLEHRLEERGPDEIARVAAAFNSMADRIDGVLRTERELMAGMSHELRTPLARLRLALELLRDEGAPEKRITAIEGDIAELEGLIAQLLQLSRLQLREQPLEVTRVDLKALAERARDTAALPDHPVSVEGPGGQIEGDAELLHRVLVNLLQNAGRYAPPKSPILVTVHGGEVTVEDEGPGVPEDQLARLFDPFWRAEGSRARATGGLGLGLMLVRQVVELHEGTVRAENRPAGGLQVTVSLPMTGARPNA
jgi:signal transduction histidine kinase